MHTTPPSPIAMSQVFPQVAEFARTTVRLHPRRGAPTVEQSSVGGPLLWPSDEPWPTCRDDDFDPEHPSDPVPLVPVAQLLAVDVPELPFPDGTDLLQVLWCPFVHDPWSAPQPELRWRRRADVTDRLATMPSPHPSAEPEYVPNPCVIDPERVVEYPTHDLPDEVWSQIRDVVGRVETETGWQYDHDLAVASGIKVDGYPGWTQPPDWPICACGSEMHHLLTVASWEFSRGDEKRWIPIEDRPAMAGWDFRGPDEHPWHAIRNPAGLMIGDVGGVYIFVCTTCPTRPSDYRFDCS